tara:strand:- start:1253 stop:2473 length:1221 start_codon:yes stop_codon:yes gene_type:complete
MLSDHPLSTSGVGCQARYLINGLVETGKYSFRCFGAAIKHGNYDLHVVNEDFVVKPIDGFGNPDMLRLALATEKPDALFLFTDPRFFIWVWEMEEEIHQFCPIVYWHVWDNDPWPDFNRVLYESTDLVNCHSHKTYELVNEQFPEKTNFIPHALPQDVFFPLDEKDIIPNKKNILGENFDHFVGIWVNRNARRKMPGDTLVSWKMFLDDLEEKHGHRKATLIMHTDPLDQEGPNLLKVIEYLKIEKNVIFSTDRLEFEQMNRLYNACDFCVNIACNEGFGLSTLEAMQSGKPIIALKTGGLTRQVVDHRDGSENGIALDPDVRNLVGSQMVPYIYEDHVTNENLSSAFLKLYDLGPDGRKKLGKKARAYALSEFNIENTIKDWDKTLEYTIDTWRDRYSSWDFLEI